jgi:hypothetical protein
MPPALFFFFFNFFLKKLAISRAPVAHTPIILAIQEAEIRRIGIQSQPRQIVCKTLSQKILSQKRAGGVAQGISPEFRSQYGKKKLAIDALF